MTQRQILTKNSVVKNDEFEALSFHDCAIHGINWNAREYSFTLSIDFIHEWIPPANADGGYSFRVSPAEVVFDSVDYVDVKLNWTDDMMRSSIDKITSAGKRDNPNATKQTLWKIELLEPKGEIVVWAFEAELRILSDPVLSAYQFLER